MNDYYEFLSVTMQNGFVHRYENVKINCDDESSLRFSYSLDNTLKTITFRKVVLSHWVLTKICE